jgi:hypothetical protein
LKEWNPNEKVLAENEVRYGRLKATTSLRGILPSFNSEERTCRIELQVGAEKYLLSYDNDRGMIHGMRRIYDASKVRAGDVISFETLEQKTRFRVRFRKLAPQQQPTIHGRNLWEVLDQSWRWSQPDEKVQHLPTQKDAMMTSASLYFFDTFHSLDTPADEILKMSTKELTTLFEAEIRPVVEHDMGRIRELKRVYRIGNERWTMIGFPVVADRGEVEPRIFVCKDGVTAASALMESYALEKKIWK